MKLHLASTAELYAEHRRTGSTRKRQRIAAELQRRHDELTNFIRPGEGKVLWWGVTYVFRSNGDGTGFFEQQYFAIRRFDFSIGLPVQSQLANRKSEILPS